LSRQSLDILSETAIISLVKANGAGVQVTYYYALEGIDQVDPSVFMPRDMQREVEQQEEDERAEMAYMMAAQEAEVQAELRNEEALYGPTPAMLWDYEMERQREADW
jgi:hypothetical protein